MTERYLEILKEINDNLKNKPTSKDNINKIIDKMILSSRNSEKTRELAELKEFLKSESESKVFVAFENLKEILLELKLIPTLEVKNTFLHFKFNPPKPTIARAFSAPDLLNRQSCGNNPLF